MRLSQRDSNMLWGRAGGRCALCQVKLVEETNQGRAYPIANEAHVVAKSEKGPRGSAELSPKQRASVDNFILLCGSCHIRVDQAAEEWPVERLQRMKAEHEQRMDRLGDRSEVTELSGTIEVVAEDVAIVEGVVTRRTTRLAPGTHVSVDASNAQRVTGMRIE